MISKAVQKGCFDGSLYLIIDGCKAYAQGDDTEEDADVILVLHFDTFCIIF